MEDFFAAEPLLVARIKDQVDVRFVLTASQAALVDEQQQKTPAVYLLYAGGDPEGEPGRSERGDLTVFRQRWAAVVAVRNVENTASGQGIREEAGPLIVQTYRALAGWRPADGFNPLIMAGDVQAAYSEAGFGYFQLLFETNYVLV
jgi:hypothetical protein